MVGMNWLYLLHREGLSGILADESTCGRTKWTQRTRERTNERVTLIESRLALGLSSGSWKDRPNHRALCVASSSKASSHCGTVIQYVIRGCACVCACSALLCSALLCSALLTSMSRVVVGNWKREIQNWCPSLRVVLYHGAQAERAKLRKSMVQSPPNVIITTYSVAFRKQDRLFFKKRLNFSYLVLGTLSRDVDTDRLISISFSHTRRSFRRSSIGQECRIDSS